MRYKYNIIKSLSGEKIETVRRKCKAGKLKSKCKRDGTYKKYSVSLSSLSKELQERYIRQLSYAKPNVAVKLLKLKIQLKNTQMLRNVRKGKPINILSYFHY